MKIQTFAELTTADERTLRFTGLGFATHGMLAPEASAQFQQEAIAGADLVDAVSEGTRNSYERIRLFHSYGVLCYELFTTTDDLTWVVLEQALRDRFVSFYEGKVPIRRRDGTRDQFKATRFEEIAEAFRPGGSHGRQWRLELTSQQIAAMPLTLGPLLKWARSEGLLNGQRNKRVQLVVYPDLRNHFAHGAGYRVGMPNESARSIRDLAEVINRLWGHWTPGGRIYPARLRREPRIIGWSPDWGTNSPGSTLIQMRPDQLSTDTHEGWTYLIVLAAESDENLSEFDARYERTTFPSELVWGPGSKSAALNWLESAPALSDEVTHLDRLFAVRQQHGKTYLPCTPAVLLGLPADARSGSWALVKADYPIDAFAHVRHLSHGESCPDKAFGGCPVEEIFNGDWDATIARIHVDHPEISASHYSDVRVPQLLPLPADVGV